ncbi:sugar ABC transporter substrate-binding protein [Subtercola boreus]|uniref:Sugar ABC transporter substrate-binding protein n=1 Tax=Subtercola boreus TaxID=120213 RepID=A0A3E0VLL9_9MICO|nr:ABC transporter substrate-binding protein [Subtercola boreus]RFA10806.1 sugar ABC transporter substrate-binding protein [Subtercola boreus]
MDVADTPARTVPAAARTVHLRGMTWDHPRGLDSVVAASAEYTRQHPGVTISWHVRSLQAFADHPIDDLARGHDLLVIDHPHIPLAARDGLFAALDGQGHDAELAALASASLGASHATYRHDGHQYGLATDAAAQVAVYRPDLLAAADLPASWDDVFDLARGGRVLWAYKPIDAFSSLITIAANHGGEAMREPGVFLTPEQAAPALDIMHRLAGLVPPDNAWFNPIQVAEELVRDSAYAYSPLAFGYTNYSRAGFRPHRLAYADMPAGPRGHAGSLLGGAGIAVSAFTPHRAEATDFTFWLDSPEVQKGVYFDAGGQPGHPEAWEDDRTNAATLDFFRGTRATLEGAYVRPRFAGFIELQDEGSPLVTAALLGELSDAELLRRLDALTARLLVAPDVAGSPPAGHPAAAAAATSTIPQEA